MAKATVIETKDAQLNLEPQPSPQDAPLVRQESTPMQLIEIATTRGADPAQLEKLMDLQERWEKNQAVKAFGEALRKFQALCPIIHKSRDVSFNGKHVYNYAGLDDIMRIIQPILNECGLSISYSTETKDGQMLVKCKVTCGIHSEVSEVQMPVPGDVRVNDTQKMAQAMSYAKRYALCAALNIVTSNEDNDAGGMAETITDQQAQVLDDMLSQLAADRRPRFLKFMGVEKLGDIPAKRYEEARQQLAKALKEAGR